MAEEIKRKDVSSSNIKSVGYDEEKKELVIEFTKGGIYTYSDVPKDCYEEFLGAGSLGQFFHMKIKGVYQFKKG